MSLKVRKLDIQPDYKCQLALYDSNGSIRHVFILVCEIRDNAIYTLESKFVYTSNIKISFSKYSIALYQQNTLLVHADYLLSVKLKRGDTLTFKFNDPLIVV